MGTIAIRLDPVRLENPDLDLRYEVTERIEALTQGAVSDDGYDYVPGGNGLGSSFLIIFLRSAQPYDDVAQVLNVLKAEDFLGNNLYATSVVAVDGGNGYTVVHPRDYIGIFLGTQEQG